VLFIVKALGLVTVQDRGWSIGRAIGLPQSGALDVEAFVTANRAVGNESGAAVLELVGGSLTVRAEVPVVIAAGGGAGARIGTQRIAAFTAYPLPAGAVVTLDTAPTGRVGYLAVAGGIDVPVILGSRSTYLPTAFGGYQGRRLQAGDRLSLGPPATAMTTGSPTEPSETGPIRVVPGPQGHLFGDESLAALESTVWQVSAASDRMGTRLIGSAIAPRVPATLPSEATCLGAIQIPDDGQPIVLLADGPTVGGYPKIGAVITADLGRFAQLGPGASVRFSWVSLAQAVPAAARWMNRVGVPSRAPSR